MIILVIMRRKTVSRKKSAHKTKRRSRSRFHARGSRRTRVKRGGMIARAAAAAARAATRAAGTTRSAIHQSPILTGFQHAVKGAAEEAIHPVKTFDKGKSLYDKFQQGLDEEKRKQQDIENGGKSKQSYASTFSPPVSFVSPFSLQSQNRTLSDAQSPDITSLIAPRFSTPNSKFNRQYSSQAETSQNPPSKSQLNRPENSHDDDDYDDTAKILFGSETPISSPFGSPPNLSNRNKSETSLLSPSRSPAKKLKF